MIYFIENPDKSRIKIGTTARLSTRLRQLVAEYGEGLKVVAVTDGDRDRERELHQKFAHLRDVGEWFEPGDDLRAFIVSDGREWRDEDKLKPVRLDLTEEAHHLLRILSSFDGKSMSSYARDLLEDHVRSEAKRKGIKA